MMIASNMWLLGCYQSFPLIWLGDLIIDSKLPSFELDLEIIKTNILNNTQDDYFRVLTRYSLDLAWWPSFLPQVIQFQNSTKKSTRQTFWTGHDDCFENVTSRVLTMFSFD